ncbi:MAG: hypothetical protein KDA89_06990 [Planctomycetaceae bacterium]|nr:hypothetical protein [Planctomycetaceae bacterium]
MADALGAAVRMGLPQSAAALEVRLAEAQRGNLEALESDLSRFLVSSEQPDEVCEAFVQGCLLKYRLSDALELLSVWEADYPEDDRPHFYRGRILEHQLRLDDALQEYLKAVSLNHQNAAASFNAGRVLMTLKKPESAADQFLECSNTLGDPRPGWIAAAGAFRESGDQESAGRYLQMAQGFTGGDVVTAWRLVGEPSESAAVRGNQEAGELAFAREDFEQAAREFETVVAASPGDWRSRYRLSQAQRKLGENEAASANEQRVRDTRAALESCDPLISLLKRDPGNVDARFQIGLTFLKHVSPRQGLVWLDSVLDLEPSHVEAHRAMMEYFEAHSHENPEFERLAKEHRHYLPEQSPEKQSPETP